MLIVGIETSCDDTAIAVVKVERGQITVLSNLVSSQIGIHSPYGGVVPTLAAREHQKNLPIVLLESLAEAGVTMKEIDLVAVTAGPGLAPSLWRGVEFANALAEKEDKPLIAVNHMVGHIYSTWLKPVGVKSKFPMTNDKLFLVLNLIVSGGHTELVLQGKAGKLKKIGATLDDAAGEAFDKVARLLGLGFPGGPEISARADKFQMTNYKLQIKLPRPMLHSKDFNFSFSGLKTAVLYWIRDNAPKKMSERVRQALCHEFQNAVVEVLVKKTIAAAKKYQVKTVALSGGVSANQKLRETLQGTLAKELPKVKFMKPKLIYTGDNGAMIALAGYLQAARDKRQATRKSIRSVKAAANWEIT